MTLPFHPEDCNCDDCQNEEVIIDGIVGALVELGGSTIGPRMRVPGENDPYYDIFLTRDQLDKKYP